MTFPVADTSTEYVQPMQRGRLATPHRIHPPLFDNYEHDAMLVSVLVGDCWQLAWVDVDMAPVVAAAQKFRIRTLLSCQGGQERCTAGHLEPAYIMFASYADLDRFMASADPDREWEDHGDMWVVSRRWPLRWFRRERVLEFPPAMLPEMAARLNAAYNAWIFRADDDPDDTEQGDMP